MHLSQRFTKFIEMEYKNRGEQIVYMCAIWLFVVWRTLHSTIFSVPVALTHRTIIVGFNETDVKSHIVSLFVSVLNTKVFLFILNGIATCQLKLEIPKYQIFNVFLSSTVQTENTIEL